MLLNENGDIRSEDLNPSISFEDCKPQINWMSRVWFSLSQFQIRPTSLPITMCWYKALRPTHWQLL